LHAQGGASRLWCGKNAVAEFKIAMRASMTYLGRMDKRPVTVSETHVFRRMAEKIWNETELAELVDYLAHNPEAGDLVPGTGGVRKLRWGRTGSGKRGGARVIYFYFDPDHPLYALLAFAKAQSEDMSADEKRREIEIVDSIRQKAKGLQR
jgi:RelE toxin of RelE / RelB toxin-antitoxin system